MGLLQLLCCCTTPPPPGTCACVVPDEINWPLDGAFTIADMISYDALMSPPLSNTKGRINPGSITEIAGTWPLLFKSCGTSTLPFDCQELQPRYARYARYVAYDPARTLIENANDPGTAVIPGVEIDFYSRVIGDPDFGNIIGSIDQWRLRGDVHVYVETDEFFNYIAGVGRMTIELQLAPPVGVGLPAPYTGFARWGAFSNEQKPFTDPGDITQTCFPSASIANQILHGGTCYTTCGLPGWRLDPCLPPPHSPCLFCGDNNKSAFHGIFAEGSAAVSIG